MVKKMEIVFNNANAEGLLTCRGLGSFPCLGMPGLDYPAELMIDPAKPGVKAHPYYSRTYGCAPNNNAQGQCIMNYAILIWGQQGVYIHEWPTPANFVGNGNRGTHGCIHLQIGDARKVYEWVDGKTYVTIARPW